MGCRVLDILDECTDITGGISFESFTSFTQSISVDDFGWWIGMVVVHQMYQFLLWK